MASQSLILSSLEPEALQQMIRDAVADGLTQQQAKNAEPEDEVLLTRQEVADIYKISLVTLRKWEKNKIIPGPIRKGDRVFFLKSKIYDDINTKDDK